MPGIDARRARRQAPRAQKPVVQKYISMYILLVSNQRAKLFQNGGSQAVRLPQSFRFPEGSTEVVIRREGRQVILEPLDEWPEDFESALGAWSKEIPRPPASPQRDPFA